MKALPFKIPKPKNLGLIYQEDKGIFYDKFHQHEEIQISYIVSGKGTLVVGDTIHQYYTNDLFIIGSNLPHLFKSDLETSENSFMISLFFTEQSFGQDFFALDDFKSLENVLKKTVNGFKIGTPNTVISQHFHALKNSSDLERFIIFLKLLQEFNNINTESLSKFIYPKKYTENHGRRMQIIMNYTMNNFNSEIDLNSIAEKANMTKNAFCNYFKKRTNKTYFTFLNELRVENACKLLLENKETAINEIAYQSGYSSLSNFNRKFLAVKKMTPSQYRKNH
ncbi:AraC family transcriptional regulator [Tenacibaculum jejuense]|uniref:Transcriptional regulator, AraC family n=1 Tax=Tenacibaculum jejuense TaxID=584609 RepID=A0A238UDW6_9FLAO|nr:helix-turn-helix transcriptional regulator [Tenacibaculum jejuense]SNR17272.1 Transcriptional regulator, AraC family [Tenacibaculum jejuense]